MTRHPLVELVVAQWTSNDQAAIVPNNGIEHDERWGADFITFYDPDGIAWEFYASAQ